MNPAEYFLAAIKADPNLLGEFKRQFEIEAKAEEARKAKREEKRQDDRDAALWQIRGGRME